jgi:hypothetical protein
VKNVSSGLNFDADCRLKARRRVFKRSQVSTKVSAVAIYAGLPLIAGRCVQAFWESMTA